MWPVIVSGPCSGNIFRGTRRPIGLSWPNQTCRPSVSINVSPKRASQHFRVPMSSAGTWLGILGVLLIGCSAETDTEMPASNLESFADDGKAHSESLRFLALGDSYTIGEGVAENDRWPVQLATRLQNEGVDIGEPTIIARTGWTTSELLAGIDRAKPGGVFQIVSLQIGVNNQYRGLSENNFLKELQKLLEIAVEFASGDTSRVLVLSIPDWGVTLCRL